MSWPFIINISPVVAFLFLPLFWHMFLELYTLYFNDLYCPLNNLNAPQRLVWVSFDLKNTYYHQRMKVGALHRDNRMHLSPLDRNFQEKWLWTMEPLKLRNIHDLYTTDTSLIITLSSVTSVSVLERFDCITEAELHRNKSWCILNKWPKLQGTVWRKSGGLQMKQG